VARRVEDRRKLVVAQLLGSLHHNDKRFDAGASPPDYAANLAGLDFREALHGSTPTSGLPRTKSRAGRSESGGPPDAIDIEPANRMTCRAYADGLPPELVPSVEIVKVLPTVGNTAVLELEDDAVADIQALAVPLRAAALDADYAVLVICKQVL
jgi:hypothetical protein